MTLYEQDLEFLVILVVFPSNTTIYYSGELFSLKLCGMGERVEIALPEPFRNNFLNITDVYNINKIDNGVQPQEDPSQISQYFCLPNAEVLLAYGFIPRNTGCLTSEVCCQLCDKSSGIVCTNCEANQSNDGKDDRVYEKDENFQLCWVHVKSVC